VFPSPRRGESLQGDATILALQLRQALDRKHEGLPLEKPSST
jgi:hypothetical protein